MTRALHVHGIGLWARGEVPGWLAARAQPSDAVPAAALLPVRARGRASLLTRMFAEVIEQATASCAAERADLPMIFGSCYGEMMITGALLQMMNEHDGAVSPARFQASVHNGAAGVLSITLQSRGFSTCLAAGHGTVAACLEEAAAYLECHGGRVVVAVADETLPAFLSERARVDPLALAVCLGVEAGEGDLALRLSSTPDLDVHAITESDTPRTPHADALPLWRALIEGRDAQVLLPALGGRVCSALVERVART